MVQPRCYADPNPMFQPAMRLIAAISNSDPATVTTTFAHQYVTGTIVRLDVPFVDGMQQITGRVFPITVTGPTTFTIPEDTTNYDVFAIPNPAPIHQNTCAQVIPVGEINSTLLAAVRNILPFGP